MQVFDESFAKEFPAVTRWFLTLVHQPQFAKVMGAVEMAKEPMKYDGKKSPAAAAPKKESKPEQPKKEKAPPPAAKVRPPPGHCIAALRACRMSFSSCMGLRDYMRE